VGDDLGHSSDDVLSLFRCAGKTANAAHTAKLLSESFSPISIARIGKETDSFYVFFKKIAGFCQKTEGYPPILPRYCYDNISSQKLQDFFLNPPQLVPSLPLPVIARPFMGAAIPILPQSLRGDLSPRQSPKREAAATFPSIANH
jgi:hypothetical protein